MISSRKTANVKFIITKIILERLDLCREFKVKISAIIVSSAPAAEIEHPIIVNRAKIL